MKPNEYIKKYSLDSLKLKGTDNEKFVADFHVDYEALLLSTLDKNGDANIKGYDQTVKVMRDKWDAIQRKTANSLNEGLWKFMYATIFAKVREELFPEEMKRRKEEKEQKQKEWEDRKRFNTQWNRQYVRENIFEHLFGGFDAFISNFIKGSTPSKYFGILGIPVDSKEPEIISAFRKLSMEHHPDKGGDGEMFRDIVEAKDFCLKFIKG